MAKLESLIVDLKLNNAELKKAVDETNKKLDSLGDRVKKLSGQMNLGAVAKVAKDATVALVNFVRHGAETADQTGKMAAAAGVSVESFSRLQYAAQLGGVGAEEFSAALARLNKNISEAATGSKEQAATFAALGVSVKDAGGNVKAADVVFAELADAFNSLAPGASKAKLEMDLFGKSGAKLESVFEGGAAGLRAMGDEADRLGITISSSTAAAAQEFNDNFERLELALERVGVRVAGEVAPAFTKLTDFLLDSKEGADLLKGAVTTLATVMKILASVAIVVGTTFDVVGTAIGGVLGVIVEVASGNLTGAADAFNQVNKDLTKDLRSAKKMLDAVWVDGAADAETGSKRMKRSADDVAKGAANMKKALTEQETAMKELAKVSQDLETKIASFGKGPMGELDASLDSGHLAEQLKKAGKAGEQLGVNIREAVEHLKELERFKLLGELDFEGGRTARADKRQANARQVDFDMVGASPRQRAEVDTFGFESFDKAMKDHAAALAKRSEALAKVELAKLAENGRAVREFTLVADGAEVAAENAWRAADGFQTLAELDFEESKARIEQTLNGLASIGLQFASELGDLGDVINAGVKGAESGGVWGAIIAVVIELLSKFERFSEILDIASGAMDLALTDMFDGFSGLIDGIRPLMGAISGIAEAFHDILGPILGIVGKLFKQIAGTLQPLGIIMQQIGSSLAPLFTIIGAIVDILKIFQPILSVVSLTMLGLKLAIDYVNLGFQMFLDWLMETFKWGNNNSGVEAAEKQIKEDLKEIDELLKQMEKDPFNAVTNVAEGTASDLEKVGAAAREAENGHKKVGEAADKTSDSLNRLTGAFTNVPAGFRLNGRRFNATDPVNTGGPTGSGDTYIIQGSVISERELLQLVENNQKKKQFQRTGVS